MSLKVENVQLEKKYHSAVEHWSHHHFKDYPTLFEKWDQYFPTDEKFCLCAKMEVGTSDVIAIGDQKGEKKRENPDQQHDSHRSCSEAKCNSSHVQQGNTITRPSDVGTAPRSGTRCR